HLDLTVFAFTLAVAVVTGLLFGLVPALTASKADLQESLREGGRGSTVGRGQLRLRNLLVVGETGLACILLISAGLLLHSFVNLLRTDPGFQPQKVLTAEVSLPSEQYRSGKETDQFFKHLIAELKSQPGVRYAGIGTDLPWTGYDENYGGFKIEGRSAEYNDKTTARYHAASPEYFQALGIPLISGRFFNDVDDVSEQNVLIINQAMANRYWPGEDAVGKRLTGSDNPTEKDWFHIVGVVGDVKDQPDSESAKPAFWWAHHQQPISDMFVVLRSDLDDSTVIDQLRSTVKELNPGLAVADIRFMNRVVDDSVSGRRFALFLVSLFAGLALVLATIGMYGVISYSVNRRMHEFGIRMALGAKRWDLMQLIVGQGLKLFAIGAVAGLISAAVLSRLMGSMLYGISGTDPVTFATVGLVALLTTTLACYLPARTAGEADP